jgi:transcriptional regulator with XRE-family HTH domain
MRVLRRRLGLTLKEVARRSGLTYPTVESVETNKTQPSLKTLDAIAGALQMSTSDLVGLAERRLVQRRTAKTPEQERPKKSDIGVDNCRIAYYDKGKVVRVVAQAGQRIHAMGLHENVHEFCYVISGQVDLMIQDEHHILSPDDTILFDGLVDHSYALIEDGEIVTIHIPKDIRVIAQLLDIDSEAASAPSIGRGERFAKK